MAVTVESTTAEQYELDHAVSPDGKDPAALDRFKEEAEKAAPGAEKAEKKAESGTDTHKEPEGKKDAEEDGLPVGVRKRIDKLTARAKAAEETVTEMRARLEALEKSEKPPEKKAEAKPPAERPKRGDFLAQGKTDEEYEDALFAWRKGEDQRQAESADIEERTKEVVATYKERMNEAKEKYDDFDQKLSETNLPWDAKNPQDMQASKAFQIAIRECENGPEVLYHIATHPEVAESFGGLSSARTQLLIGRLSASLLPSETPTKKDPPKTKVNTPPKVVGGSANTSGYDPYKDPPKDHKQYMAWRKAQGSRAN